MVLYRVSQRWSNDRIALTAGCTYELTAEEVHQVSKDIPDNLTLVTAGEVARLSAVLAEVGIVNASFRPPAPDHSGRGRGAGAVMHSGSMPGLTR